MEPNDNPVEFSFLRSRLEGRVNLVVIGRTGDGKSSTLNSIMQHSDSGKTPVPFEVCDGSRSVTKAYNERIVKIFGLNCRLIDTMGLFDTDLTPERKAAASILHVPDLDEDQKVVLFELSKVVQLCSDGVDAFIFVMTGVGRFSNECRQTLRIILRFLGSSMLDHCIFVLTNKDRAKSEGVLEQTKRDVKDYLLKSGYRAPQDDQFVAFDNETHPAAKEQVVELFEAVESLLKRFDGQAYESGAFVAAKEELDAEKSNLLKERQKELAELLDKETEKITKVYEAKNEDIKRRLEEKEDEICQIGAASEDDRRESQRKIEELKTQMEMNDLKAQTEREKAAKVAIEESHKLLSDQIRALEQKRSEEFLANQQMLQALQGQLVGVASAHGSGCFPASAMVHTATGHKTVASLKVGDVVYTLNEQHNSVELNEFLGFMEIYESDSMDFIKVSFTNGRNLTLTGTHKIFVKRVTDEVVDINANELAVGDEVICMNLFDELMVTTTRVARLKYVNAKGIYLPLTSSGTLFVDGVFVSCYGQTVPAVVRYSHRTAHKAMKPSIVALRYGIKSRLVRKLFANYSRFLIVTNSLLGSIAQYVQENIKD